jgi:EmrB/QacA subfamily drug resistance transporter
MAVFLHPPDVVPNPASIYSRDSETAGDIVPSPAPASVPPSMPPSPAALTPAARWAAFVVLLVGGFLPPLDFFVVNVALPSVRAQLEATPAQVQLVISGYAAGYAVFLITGGRLGDLYGRRRLFVLGLIAFTATSALCGFAPSATVLVIGRVLEGLAAALLGPQVLAAIRSLYSDRELGRALGLYGAMIGLAAAAGQFLGGFLTQLDLFGLGWRSVFLINVPIGFATVIGAFAFVPPIGPLGKPTLDFGGAALVSLALACLVLPLSEGRQQGWPAWTFAMLAAAPVLVAALLWFEARVKRIGLMPLIDLDLFRIASFRRGVLVATLFFFTSAFYLLFAIYQQDGRGMDPLATGIAILPYGVGLFLGPLASTPLPVRLRPHLLGIGMGIEVLGYASIMVAGFTLLEGPLLAAMIFVTGFGQGIAMPRLFNTVLGEVPPAQAGLASGVVNSSLQAGAAIAVAAIGSLFFSILGDGTTAAAYAHAFGWAMAAQVAALALALLIAVLPARRRVAGALAAAPAVPTIGPEI